MIDDKNQGIQIKIDDFLKTDLKIGRIKFNALKLLHELEIPEELGDECYIKHVIPKHDGTKRTLFEPKPLLKEIQRQLICRTVDPILLATEVVWPIQFARLLTPFYPNTNKQLQLHLIIRRHHRK